MTDEAGFALAARGDRPALVPDARQARGARDRAARMSLCIVAAGKTVTLAVAAFTLSWTHSVEKTRWEEDWTVGAGRAAHRRGAGAGLGRRDGAARGRGLKDGWWVYAPELGALPQAGAGRIGRDRRRLDAVHG